MKSVSMIIIRVLVDGFVLEIEGRAIFFFNVVIPAKNSWRQVEWIEAELMLNSEGTSSI